MFMSLVVVVVAKNCDDNRFVDFGCRRNEKILLLLEHGNAVVDGCGI
jgi:hypothetical protein